jgi:hypothetical protein
MPDSPSPLNELLRQQIIAAHERDKQIIAQNTSGTILEIPSTGKIVSTAYEQLRNAAEYAQEHLLLQRAIKRFFKRNLFVANRRGTDLGIELIVDLTQAGYLRESQFSRGTSEKLNSMIEEHMAAFGRLRQAHISRETAESWILALLATNAEHQLDPHSVEQASLFFAYEYFLHSLPKDTFVDASQSDDYDFCLYIAIHQSILKSDTDLIRCNIHNLYQQSLEDTAGLIYLSKRIDDLSVSQLTQRLKRAVSRYGAPFRIIKSLNEDHNDAAQLLTDKNVFLEAYDKQIDREYKQLDKRLARGLVKSIVFLIITKFLIGLAVEVPYDLGMHGKIFWIPLAINLFFPPLYMASLVFSLSLPTSANKRSIRNYTEQLLFSDTRVQIQLPKRRRRPLGVRIAYSLLFFVPIIITVLILRRVGFNVVQMGIFFVFFSTASFLGFRLSALVRDLELTTRQLGLLTSLQDFFYLPFVLSGQWLSRKYSQINLVARIMDVAIELPLKTVLRLLRQWMGFLREKHEELY